MERDANGVRIAARGPRGVYVGLLVVGIVLVGLGLWYLTDDAAAALVLVPPGIALGVVGARGMRARVLAFGDRLLIVNVFSTITLTREDILTVRVWPTTPDQKVAPGVALDRRDGTAVIPTALQFDGWDLSPEARRDEADRAADELVHWLRSGDPV